MKSASLILLFLVIATQAQNATYVKWENFVDTQCGGRPVSTTFYTTGICIKDFRFSYIYLCVNGTAGWQRHYEEGCTGSSDTPMFFDSCDIFTTSSQLLTCTNTLPNLNGFLVETGYRSNTTCSGPIDKVTITPGCQNGSGCQPGGKEFRCGRTGGDNAGGNGSERLALGFTFVLCFLAVFLL